MEKKNQTSIDLPTEDSAISLKNSGLELEFTVIQRAAGHNRHSVGYHIGFLIFCITVWFIK